MESSEIEVRCLEIVDELIHEHRQWVTYELLVSIMLDRFSVTKLEDLGVTHVENIPTLHLALELNRRISSFLHVYCANRGIVTLLNLEVDTCAMLRTFHYPAVSDLKKKLDRSAVDPNEIGIGIGSDDARASSSSRVEDFGLGELQSHPYVRCLFPTVGVANQEKLKSVGDVLTGLCDYLKRARSQASDNDPNNNIDFINVDELKSFLLEEVWSSDAYDSLDQAGIDLKYVSKHEILACNQQLALLEDIQIGDKYNNVAETAVGIMRNKRLYDDHAHYVSPSAKKAKTRGDGLAPGHVDLVLNNRHNDNKAHSLLAEEIPAEDLQELCFAKEWAGNSATTAAVVKDVGRWGEALVYHFLLVVAIVLFALWWWGDPEAENWHLDKFGKWQFAPKLARFGVGLLLLLLSGMGVGILRALIADLQRDETADDDDEELEDTTRSTTPNTQFLSRLVRGLERSNKPPPPAAGLRRLRRGACGGSGASPLPLDAPRFAPFSRCAFALGGFQAFCFGAVTALPPLPGLCGI